MQLQRTSWQEKRIPGEGALRRRMEAEGWDIRLWRDPSERTYGAHTHSQDESLWVIRGRIVVQTGGWTYALGPGDRLDLPKGIIRSARAGPEGALYLIGRRFDDDPGTH